MQEYGACTRGRSLEALQQAEAAPPRSEALACCKGSAPEPINRSTKHRPKPIKCTAAPRRATLSTVGNSFTQYGRRRRLPRGRLVGGGRGL